MSDDTKQPPEPDFLETEDGRPLLTEDGKKIEIEKPEPKKPS